MSFLFLPHGSACVEPEPHPESSLVLACLAFNNCPRRRAERRGECLSRMLLAHERGTTSASEIGLLATFSGGPIFCNRLFPTPFGKLGDRKPGGRSACAGVVCAMRERKAFVGTEDIRQGIEKHRARRHRFLSWFTQSESIEPKHAGPSVAHSVFRKDQVPQARVGLVGACQCEARVCHPPRTGMRRLGPSRPRTRRFHRSATANKLVSRADSRLDDREDTFRELAAVLSGRFLFAWLALIGTFRRRGDSVPEGS